MSLVVIADEVSRDWTVAERNLLLKLTECARAIAEGGAELMTLAYTKERCVRNLTMTGDS